jgi:hypothetical protein
MSNFKKENGTGMVAPPTGGAPAGAVTSREATKKHPRQGMKVDTNKHGIRRETSLIPKPPKKTGRKKI